MRAPNQTAEAGRPAWRPRFSTIVGLLAVGLAVFLIHRTLGQYSLDDLVSATLSVPTGRIVKCLAFAGLSYLSLTGFDWLALRHVGRPLPYLYVARASFCSLSIGHNIGFAALSSGAIRYRFYSRAGIPLADIATLIVFCGVTVGFGLSTLGGLALLIAPDHGAAITGISRNALVVVGILCLSCSAGYVALSCLVRRQFSFRRWSFRLPTPGIALGQIAIGSINYIFVTACLHQAISALNETPFLTVVVIYVIANVTSLISHVPGGLGVLEGVVLYFLPHDRVIGALMIFRLTYFLIPLVIGTLLFGMIELSLRLRRT
jgi:glycosyltransferase 2 family protein